VGGAIAFHVFFSLFPLMILLVTVASLFVDRDRAGKEVIAYMESYVPISGAMQHHIRFFVKPLMICCRAGGKRWISSTQVLL
jgi:uncharacterized BrkB/YihY/UPF0761 family membrane protein